MDRFIYAFSLFALVGSAWAQPGKPDADAQSKPEPVLFDTLPVVEAASLHTQSLMAAPASVTVITAEEIERRGYRTLAEALADAPGLYVTSVRIYDYVGVRGFSVPGDLSTRFLVMIDGHPLTDNIYRSAGAFGQDFGLDMNLIKRIEIVRGPSSALYGSNGMFATVNIVTQSPVEYQRFLAAAETDSFGKRKAQVSSSEYLGKGVNLLFSASVFNDTGHSLYFPNFDSPQTNQGWADGVDAEKGYHTFANLIWRNWSFLGYFNSREKLVPTGAYGSVFNDPGTKFIDGSGFVDSSYQRTLGAGELRWRVNYGEYRSRNRVDLATDSGTIDGREGGEGDWVGTQLTYRFADFQSGFLTLGSEASFDLRTRMYAYTGAPVYQGVLSLNPLSRSWGLFAQQEWQFSSHWMAYAGGRVDGSRYQHLALTPRFGLVYQPSQASALKLLYGRSFRSPSAFEQFYQDGVTQLANPRLDSEAMQTFEADFEKRVSKKVELDANLYHYRLSNLITAVPLNDSLQQFQNAASMQSIGFELEARAELGSRFKLDASLGAQESGYGMASPAELNSPARVGKLLLDSRFFGGRLSVSGALQYTSERLAFGNQMVPDVYLVNLTGLVRRLPGNVDLHFGVRNLLNRQYWDPASLAAGTNEIEQDGRSVFVRFDWVPEREPRQSDSGRSGTGGGLGSAAARNNEP